MKNEMKETFGVLVLFFFMTLVSIAMVFSKFEEGVENFWYEQEELAQSVDNMIENDIFNLDNTKKSGGVDENVENSTLSK